MTRRELLVGAAACGAACAMEQRTTEGPAAPAWAVAVREAMTKRVAAGEFPGAVWLIARGDDEVFDAVGTTAPDGREPMRRDTIFRMASMTKPVTAAAVMMLVEDGKVDLDAPAHDYLPELADRRVLRRLDGPLDDTVPAERDIRVRDLMTFTLGFGINFDPSLPIEREAARLQLVTGAPVPMTPHAPDEWMQRFATLPLMHQPGARWMYNTGSLLQGVLVARASGQPFDTFVHERLLDPLGMVDTGFFVPAAKLGRFAGCGWTTDTASGTRSRMDRDGAASAYASRPVFPSGAAGLVSTVDDYLRFARMLLRRGSHDGNQLLSEASVREMTRDHLTPEQKAASTFFPDFFTTNGWGYGVGVLAAPDAISSTVGRYGWDGGFGTAWLNDPTLDLIGIVLTQSSDFLFNGAQQEFWQGVYASEAT